MIIGVGIDHCDIARMENVLSRYGHRLAKRYCQGERRYCFARENRRVARFAMLFAAKEAAAKALGTGFRQGVSLSNIEVIHLPSGQPTLAFHGKAAQRLEQLCATQGNPHAHVSLSDEAGIAQAIVVLECQ